MVIQPLFDATGTFRDGLAYAETEGTWGYIDRAGKFVWKAGTP